MKHDWNAHDINLYDPLQPEEPDTIQQPPPSKKTDPVLRHVATQIIACCLALAAALGIKLLGGDVYRNVRDKYRDLFCDVTSAGQVLDAISGRFSTRETSDTTVTPTAVPAMAAVSDTVVSDAPAAAPVLTQGELPDTADDSLALPQAELLQTAAAWPAGSGDNGMARPVSGTITSGFGYRTHPIYGTTLFHNGVDIGAQWGSDIVAALAGMVVTAEYDASYGYHVVLDHGGAMRTVYAHCSGLLVKEGQTVAKGQVIAKVGSTGVATGPHLHFEVRSGDYRIDPRWLMDFE